MGQKSTYKCNQCGYSVLTSGRQDMGMMAVTDTFTCKACKEIVDVAIGQFGQAYAKGEIQSLDPKEVKRMQYYTCPKCKSTDRLVKWDIDLRPCPRCGGEMNVDADGEVMLWD